MAKSLLAKKAVPFTEINVAGNSELRGQMTQRAGGLTSVPQIFIGNTHVGGADDLFKLDAAGRLDRLLNLEPQI